MIWLLKALLHFHAADASKPRAWLDSSITLLEGSLPSPRSDHGYVATEDGKIYVFGGFGPNGEHFSCPFAVNCAIFRTLLIFAE